MPSFDEHINQANHNLLVLQNINGKIADSWDWQVTVVYYTAVHLINAHISHTAGLHYRNHADVENAINSFNTLSPACMPENSFLAFKALNGLSRRSRYLINDDLTKREELCHFTYDKHFSRAMKKLDILVDFMVNQYSVTIQRVDIKCIELHARDLNHATVV